MAQAQDNFKRGTAEFLILSLLCEEEMHGYRILQEMQSRSEGRYTLLEGTLYLILMRMEEENLLTSRAELVGKKRTRRYYTVTERGKQRLTLLLHEFDEIMCGIDLILGRKGGESHDESGQTISDGRQTDAAL